MRSTYHHHAPSPRRLLAGAWALMLLLGCMLLGPEVSPASAAGSSTLLIEGAGDGHGVGMSQEGALGFAQHGWSYQAILTHYYTGTALGRTPAGTQVRVLLAGNRKRFSFSGASLAAGHALNPASVYTVTLSGHGVKLSGPATTITAGALNVTGPGALVLRGGAENGLANGSYRGTLEFSPARHGGLNAINLVGLEDYVRGTVANEMPSSWPASALDAQAIASRTYAITSQAGPGGEFDLYSDTRSQLYRGVAGESARSNAAVSATVGQIVTYNSHPVITFFFASSGGKTENVQDAFGGTSEPWLRGVSDPFDQGPQHSWRISMSFQNAAARLSGLVHGTFTGIEVLKRGYSPRVLEAYVLGSTGRTAVTGSELAQRLGLYDSWAYFSVRGAHGLQPEPDRSSTSPPTGATEQTPSLPIGQEGAPMPISSTTGGAGA